MLIFAAEAAALRSPVSIATTLPPTESPTKRMPSGPKASAPADMRGTWPDVRSASGLAGLRAAVTLNARAAIRHTATAVLTNAILRMLILLLGESRATSHVPRYGMGVKWLRYPAGVRLNKE